MYQNTSHWRHCLNPLTPPQDRPQENAFLLLCNRKEISGRVLKIWRTYGRDQASAGRDPPQPKGLDFFFFFFAQHAKVSQPSISQYLVCVLGLLSQQTSGVQGAPQWQSDGNVSPSRSHTALGKDSLITKKPRWAEHKTQA